MEACDEKEVKPMTNDAPVVEGARRAYAKPELLEFGDVRELTRGGNTGSRRDGAFLRRF